LIAEKHAVSQGGTPLTGKGIFCCVEWMAFASSFWMGKRGAGAEKPNSRLQNTSELSV